MVIGVSSDLKMSYIVSLWDLYKPILCWIETLIEGRLLKSSRQSKGDYWNRYANQRETTERAVYQLSPFLFEERISSQCEQIISSKNSLLWYGTYYFQTRCFLLNCAMENSAYGSSYTPEENIEALGGG